jgi:hypothetical protein
MSNTKKADVTIKPSDEQEKIIQAITNGKNVIVNAVAGSGKTTTLLFIAQRNTEKKILQITYNKQLKFEVRAKVEKVNINNVEIQTYHSLAVRYYNPKAYTDEEMIKILEKDSVPRFIPRYDIVVIDEAQDMTQNYYELVYKFLQDIGFEGNLLILGDSYQGVYEFKNADTRYLLLAHKLWKRNFEFLALNQSYRLSTNIASFVNKIMIGHDRIVSNKKVDQSVHYYRVNAYEFTNELFMLIKKMLNVYRPDDFFVLSPSVKSTDNPPKKLENLLVANNIPVYFSRSDEEGINEDVISNKVVFTTFHQAKGRERKIVIVFGFDESYFDHFAKEKNRNQCPSELYVAVTRASETLIVIEDYSNGTLSFLKKQPSIIKKYSFIKYIDNRPISYKKKKQEKKKNASIHKTTVKEMTMYLSEITVTEIVPLLNMLFKVLDPGKSDINIPQTIKSNKNLIEDVTDLNGIVIPAMYETKIKGGKSTLHKLVEAPINLSNENAQLILKKQRELKNYPTNSIEQYLLMGNLFIALSEGIFSKLNQIDSYTWLNQEIVDKCHKNMVDNIGQDTVYEQVIEDNNKNYYSYNHDQYGTINISGRIDAIDTETLWEFKCVNTLTVDHLLQLTIYAWLWERTMKLQYGKRKYKILNIRTGEIQELNYQDHLVNSIIELIFINKYDMKCKDDDDEFIQKNNKINDKYPLCKDDVFSVFGIER